MGVQGFSFGLVLGLPGARRTRRGSCKPERWFTRVGQQSWRWCLGRCPKGSSASLITPYWPGGTQNAVLISNIKVYSIFFFQCYSAGSIVAFAVRATWKINGLLVLLPLWFFQLEMGARGVRPLRRSSRFAVRARSPCVSTLTGSYSVKVAWPGPSRHS